MLNEGENKYKRDQVMCIVIVEISFERRDAHFVRSCSLVATLVMPELMPLAASANCDGGAAGAADAAAADEAPRGGGSGARA